jgi:hypothetical protein
MLSSAILRRSGVAALGASASKKTLGSAIASHGVVSRRFKSDDVGDVIGIDLGTTNSCVSIMVRIINILKFVGIMKNRIELNSER